MEKFCPNCGTPLEEGARFCGGCGAKRTDTAGQPVQQTQQQYMQQSPAQPQYAPPEPEQKKRSKTPLHGERGNNRRGCGGHDDIQL